MDSRRIPLLFPGDEIQLRAVKVPRRGQGRRPPRSWSASFRGTVERRRSAQRDLERFAGRASALDAYWGIELTASVTNAAFAVAIDTPAPGSRWRRFWTNFGESFREGWNETMEALKL